MDIQWVSDYFKRIGYHGGIEPTVSNFTGVHRAHLLTVPFEDLDIHYGTPLSLEVTNLFQKVVKRNRGGFCYELNHLFGNLLKNMGYKVTTVAAQVYNDQGRTGPTFDHMALIVELEEQWLADVGFGGGSFLQPLLLNHIVVQQDPAGYYRIDQKADGRFCLTQSIDGQVFKPLYDFDLVPQQIENFQKECHVKQTDPSSHFVRNKICTLATSLGRKTLLNETFTERTGEEKHSIDITDPQVEKELLIKHFGIRI